MPETHLVFLTECFLEMYCHGHIGQKKAVMVKQTSNNAAVYYQNKNNERHYFIAYAELGADKMQEDTLSLLFSADE